MLFDNHDQLGSPQLISTVLLEDKPSDEKTPLDEEFPSTTVSQITEEFNTLQPSVSDTNSNVNSQDSIGVTDLPTQTETSNKLTDNSVVTNDDNNIPVTVNTLETIENENNTPIENDQISENEKPVLGHEVVTNNPETLNNEEHHTLPSSSNESQDHPTEEPNYDSTVANVLSASGQTEKNSGLDESLTVTTHNPNVSIENQQVDDDKGQEGVSQPTSDAVSDQNPAAEVTDLPTNVVNPSDMTQIPTIVADEKPLLINDNGSGFRPTNIDDIISSVNMVKDAVKNSLEYASKPAELDYQTTNGMIDTYQPTVVPFSENSLPNNVPQTTLSSAQVQTDVVNENLPESPTVTGSSDEEITQAPTLPPSLNADQGISTNLPMIIPDTQEIPSSPNTPNANINVKRPEETVDDRISEVTTIQYLPTSTNQDSISNGPETHSDSNIPQVNVESSTNLPEVVSNDKTPEITTQVLPSLTQHEVLTDDTVVNKPVVDDEVQTNTEHSNSPVSEVNANKAPVKIPTQDITSQSSTSIPIAEDITDDTNVNIVEPSSSPAPSKPTPIQEDTKLPSEESGDTMQIPFETEKPSPKPSTNAPLVPAYNTQKPPSSYTPIPQSTWTPKPFHQDSTSEASLPDQGFSDEYDDENEAVFGPGTCR